MDTGETFREMTPERPSFASRDDAIPWSIAGLGVAFLLSFVAETAVFTGPGPAAFLNVRLLAGFLIVSPGIAGLVYGGYWLAASDLDPDRYARVLGWCLVGGAALGGINGLVQLIVPVPDLRIAVGLLRGGATLGCATGLLVGVVEARAVQNAIDAERSTMRAEYLERQRDWLDYFNGLLRHEVLNTAQVIVGYSETLQANADVDETERDHLETIRRQSQDMTQVIRDVRLMIDATHGETDFRPVAVEPPIRAELQDLLDTYDDVDVETDLADVAVLADDLLPRVFSNLFSNAVEHNDSETPRVRVRVEPAEETAVVRVADNGPGVPPDRRDELFERRRHEHSGIGVGLHVVDLLVERYDGHVELTETGPDGSVFTVELPLAGDGEGRSVPAPRSAPGADSAGSDDPAVPGSRADGGPSG